MNSVSIVISSRNANQKLTLQNIARIEIRPRPFVPHKLLTSKMLGQRERERDQ